MKRFIVTGAASGIGRHLTQRLLQQGERVCAADVQLAALEQLQQELETSGLNEQLLIHSLDVRDAQAWEALFGELADQWGGVDVLLNVAGVLKPGYSWEISPQDVDFHLDINTKGLILGTAAAARVMKAQGQGHIVNIASLAGVSPVPGLCLYSASKFAVRGFSLSAAVELKEHGVHVTCVCPDAVVTPMLDAQQHHQQAAMTFSGSKALSVEDISDAVLGKVLRKAPLEVLLPDSRGLLAKLSSLNPRVLLGLHKAMVKKGLKKQRLYRGEGAA